jgi:DNA helicase HerA-like ATPase
MRLYRKEGNTVHILSFPQEIVEKGDYLLIEDEKQKKALIAQVIDVQFANIPGILEELLRDTNNGGNDEPAQPSLSGQDFDPLEMNSHLTYIQDSRLLVCKIRAGLDNGQLSPSSTWLPSRSQSIIKPLPTAQLLKLIRINHTLPIQLGEAKDNSAINIDATALDGKLNIVTGKKGTGKSHLSKLLALSLVNHGAPLIVLDLNGEYAHLGMGADGKKNEYNNRVHVLTPGDNFKICLAQLKLRIALNILIHALNLPGTSAREFRRIWQHLDEKAALTLNELGEAIRNWHCNQHVRDALFSRYYSLVNSGFFTDNMAEAFSFEDLTQKMRGGAALVINLKDTSLVDRQIVVEYVLGKLVDLLAHQKLKAAFLFAEEAHLYLRETYWDDIVTRMRHFGVFTTFVTNQPDTIRESIYRQADNVFLFNFTNEHDLETVSRAAKVDAETVKSIARDLPVQHCLLLGSVVKDFPIVVRVKSLNVQTMGQTRLFFCQNQA